MTDYDIQMLSQNFFTCHGFCSIAYSNSELTKYSGQVPACLACILEALGSDLILQTLVILTEVSAVAILFDVLQVLSCYKTYHWILQ